VEGATKQLGVPILITGSTRQLLSHDFPTRKLCQARLSGMKDPVDLYQLLPEDASDDELKRRDDYEESLSLYVAGEWPACGRKLYPLLRGNEGSFDIPSLTLATKALECLRSPPLHFDPIWDLSSK
jgi:adenylate cyclase